MLKVVIVQIGEKPRVEEIEGNLESLRTIVDGWIECVNLGGGITLVCNEEGKLLGLPMNRVVGNDIIAGDFVLTKTDYNTGDFVDLSETEISMLLWDFSKYVIR